MTLPSIYQNTVQQLVSNIAPLESEASAPKKAMTISIPKHTSRTMKINKTATFNPGVGGFSPEANRSYQIGSVVDAVFGAKASGSIKESMREKP
jgi:NAD(P)H-hydrate repair Nnr-like enzyme with NAD(P)H-hydrate epimerase domain